MSHGAGFLALTPPTPTLGALIVGTLLLFFGRRLFWLFVGASGFSAGLEIAARVFHGQTAATLLIAAIVIGFIGMLLAFFLQKLAISLGGFAAGAYLAFSLAQMFLGRESGPVVWIAILLGGVIGLVLMHLIFNGALIVLSSILGASLLVHATSFFQAYVQVALVVLAVLGIFVQSSLRSRSRT